MIIDDEDISTFEHPTFEEHFDLIRSLSHLRTGHDLIVREVSRECLLGSCIRKENDWFLFSEYLSLQNVGRSMMMDLDRRREIEYLSFIMNIEEVNMSPTRKPLTNERKCPCKYIGNREFPTRCISLHRCCWKKWDHDMQ